MKFYTTDVFALSKYAGNQLATFIDCDHLSDKEMQFMAAEINFSETTFIISDKEVNGGYDVRIFTPKAEIDFAGHPTIGTAYIINKLYKNSKATSVKLNLKVGQIPVEINEDIYWMTQKQPEFGSAIDKNLMAEVLSLKEDELISEFPCMGVSTGLPFTIVPVKSLDSLSRIGINMHKYNDFCQLTNAKGILVFTPEGHSGNLDISSRVFVPWLGVPEDPATGSATGCLASYLLKYNFYSKSEIKLTVGQGYEMGRPSELYIDASLVDDNYLIKIGGKIFSVAQGEWEVGL